MIKWAFYICAAVGFLDFLFAFVMLAVVLIDKFNNKKKMYNLGDYNESKMD